MQAVVLLGFHTRDDARFVGHTVLYSFLVLNGLPYRECRNSVRRYEMACHQAISRPESIVLVSFTRHVSHLAHVYDGIHPRCWPGNSSSTNLQPSTCKQVNKSNVRFDSSSVCAGLICVVCVGLLLSFYRIIGLSACLIMLCINVCVQLIKPNEMTNPKVDELSMMTYLSRFPNARLRPDAPVQVKTNPARVRAYGPGQQFT